MASHPHAVAPEGASDSLFDLKRLGAAFQRRWILLAVVTAAVTAALIAVTLVLTPVWTASAQIKIDPDRHATTDLQAVANGQPPDQARVDTEVGLMRSRDVARTVVQKFKLDTDRDFVGKQPVNGSAVEEATSVLLDHTDVERIGSTYLVTLSVSAKDAQKSAALANAIAQEYLAASVRTRMGSATEDSRFLNEQLDRIGAEASAAEARAAQYRAAAGIVEGAQNGTITEQQIAPLASSLATAEAEAAAANARLTAAIQQKNAGGVQSVSGVLSSNVVADLRAKRAEILAKQGDVSARYGEKHPESISLQTQLRDIDQQLNQEAERTVAGIRSDAAAANAKVAQLRQQVGSLRGIQARESRAGVAAVGLDQQAISKRNLYNQTAQRAQAAAQQGRNTESIARIVEAAEPPLKPSFPNKPLFAILGLVLGLVAGASSVVGLESLDVGLRTGADAQKWLRAPLVASVPRLRSSQLERGGSAADYLVNAPASEFAEALRNIRQSLPAVAGSQVVTICSSLPAEGKSTVALALARIMAMSGDRVVLVDCDLRKGTVARVSGVEVDKGIVEVLSGEATLAETLVDDPLTTLKLLPVAKRGFNARDFFGGPEMEKLIASLRGQFDRIILDTPPLLAIADARSLAARSDATMMLVRWGATSKFAAQAAAARLRQDDTPISGIVLTMVEKKRGMDRSDPAYYSGSYADYYRD